MLRGAVAERCGMPGTGAELAGLIVLRRMTEVDSACSQLSKWQKAFMLLKGPKAPHWCLVLRMVMDVIGQLKRTFLCETIVD